MSASAETLALPLDPDLSVSGSWRQVPNPKKPDDFLPFVVESFCGNYTITWSVAPGNDGKVFLLWRRYPVVNGYRQTASLLGRHASARQARLAAAAHARSTP